MGVVRALGPVRAGQQFYSVFWRQPPVTAMVAESDLMAVATVQTPTEALINGTIVGYAEFQRLITYQRLNREHPLRNNIYAFNASRTQFFPFQFKPLLKLLDSSTGRLLICDEVGLGKTIEAGLILLEERARRDIRTVLIVCPAGLKAKWITELRRRFDERFTALNAASFGEFLDEYDVRPDQAELSGVISLETLRGSRFISRLKDSVPALDLLIVDEAHHIRNFDTDTRRAVQPLARDASTVILMTATPVHLGEENLFSLLNVLDANEFPDEATAIQRFQENRPVIEAQRLLAAGQTGAGEAATVLRATEGAQWAATNPRFLQACRSLESLASATDSSEIHRLTVDAQRHLADLNLLGHIFTRTRKRDVKIRVPVREAHAWTVHLSARERAFYDETSRLVYQERQRKAEHPPAVSWALNTLQRRMASSIQATVEFYQRTQPFTPDDTSDDDPEGMLPFTESLSGLTELRQRVVALVEHWPADAPDSKFTKLAELVHELARRRPSGKVLVFAFFKETLRYLSRRLDAEGIAHVRIDGDVPPVERETLIERFRSMPTCNLMLSSRVGSEGLDFQFSDTVVNYDLPWNPMEVEQRIGRLDRIGQTAEKIQIWNLWTAGTIEERILKRLYERIGVFERSIGALDPILGDVVSSLDKLLLDGSLSEEQRLAEVDRIARVVEEKRQQVEALEKEAVTFVGVDAFFEEEVEGITKGRRYVTGPQLLRFIESYLRDNAPATRLRLDTGGLGGYIVPDARLRALIQRHERAGDLIHWMGAGTGGLPFTVDARTAYDNPGVEFLNVLHPLVDMIRSDLAETLQERLSAQHLALESNLVPPGHYVVVVYRVRVKAAVVTNYLEMVALSTMLEEATDRSGAEALLGEMVERGEEPPEGLVSIDPEVAAQAAAKAQEFLLDRIAKLQAELEQSNSAIIDRKLSSLRFQYSRQIESRMALLARQQAAGTKEGVLRMTRGRIQKLEGDLRRKEAELEARRGVAIEHQEVAAALLDVSPQRNGPGGAEGSHAKIN